MKIVRIALPSLVILLFPLIGLFASGRGVAFTLAYTHEKLGVPFLSSPIGTDLFPGIVAGAEFVYAQTGNFHLLGSVVLKSSFHPGSPFGSVFSLGTEIIQRFARSGGFELDGVAGLYYTHVFSNIPTYRVSAESVTSKRNWGRPYLAINLGLGMGYNFGKRTALPLQVFVRGDVELMYAPSPGYGFLTLLPATNLIVGSRLSIDRGTKR